MIVISIKSVTSIYSVFLPNEVHIIFALFPLLSSLFPIPCSLFPVP
ncbi:hypothetical protein [Moorena sp. SIOASIH]|nr:hypothetical protein [Moorena sp. SIOASIH]